uniref:SPOC domain-containing protein n=1 Tax=Steinernema glaseri TaxID=37863 RepID=A0A1I7Y005_9BILA
MQSWRSNITETFTITEVRSTYKTIRPPVVLVSGRMPLQDIVVYKKQHREDPRLVRRKRHEVTVKRGTDVERDGKKAGSTAEPEIYSMEAVVTYPASMSFNEIFGPSHSTVRSSKSSSTNGQSSVQVDVSFQLQRPSGSSEVVDMDICSDSSPGPSFGTHTSVTIREDRQQEVPRRPASPLIPEPPPPPCSPIPEPPPEASSSEGRRTAPQEPVPPPASLTVPEAPREGSSGSSKAKQVVSEEPVPQPASPSIPGTPTEEGDRPSASKDLLLSPTSSTISSASSSSCYTSSDSTRFVPREPPRPSAPVEVSSNSVPKSSSEGGLASPREPIQKQAAGPAPRGTEEILSAPPPRRPDAVDMDTSIADSIAKLAAQAPGPSSWKPSGYKPTEENRATTNMAASSAKVKISKTKNPLDCGDSARMWMPKSDQKKQHLGARPYKPITNPHALLRDEILAQSRKQAELKRKLEERGLQGRKDADSGPQEKKKPTVERKASMASKNEGPGQRPAQRSSKDERPTQGPTSRTQAPKTKAQKNDSRLIDDLFNGPIDDLFRPSPPRKKARTTTPTPKVVEKKAPKQPSRREDEERSSTSRGRSTSIEVENPVEDNTRKRKKKNLRLLEDSDEDSRKKASKKQKTKETFTYYTGSEHRIEVSDSDGDDSSEDAVEELRKQKKSRKSLEKKRRKRGSDSDEESDEISDVPARSRKPSGSRKEEREVRTRKKAQKRKKKCYEDSSEDSQFDSSDSEDDGDSRMPRSVQSRRSSRSVEDEGEVQKKKRTRKCSEDDARSRNSSSSKENRREAQNQKSKKKQRRRGSEVGSDEDGDEMPVEEGISAGADLIHSPSPRSESCAPREKRKRAQQKPSTSTRCHEEVLDDDDEENIRSPREEEEVRQDIIHDIPKEEVRSAFSIPSDPPRSRLSSCSSVDEWMTQTRRNFVVESEEDEEEDEMVEEDLSAQQDEEKRRVAFDSEDEVSSAGESERKTPDISGQFMAMTVETEVLEQGAVPEEREEAERPRKQATSVQSIPEAPLSIEAVVDPFYHIFRQSCRSVESSKLNSLFKEMRRVFNIPEDPPVASVEAV